MFAEDGCAPIITPEANERAEDLLREHLDERQANDWHGGGFFDVTAPGGNRYRVKRKDRMVQSLDDKAAYCLQPVGRVPAADTALAHKLWLEADEAGFLEAANRLPAPNEWEGHPRCHCDMDEFLCLETVERAREWAEARNWDVTLTIDHGDFSPIYGDVGSRWGRALCPELSRYEVNGMPTDARTVDLLRQAAEERYVPVGLPREGDEGCCSCR